MRTGDTDRYWNQYLQSLPPGTERPAGYYDAFFFGTTSIGASEIAALVLQGVKTASGGLLAEYETEQKFLPKPGDLSIVVDGNDRPVCIIETTEVRIIPYDEVDERFAFDGGEEDRTLESWRRIYWEFIVSECVRLKREPEEKTPLVCERFQVVYREPFEEAT